LKPTELCVVTQFLGIDFVLRYQNMVNRARLELVKLVSASDHQTHA
jgi:hypothetical protein